MAGSSPSLSPPPSPPRPVAAAVALVLGALAALNGGEVAFAQRAPVGSIPSSAAATIPVPASAPAPSLVASGAAARAPAREAGASAPAGAASAPFAGRISPVIEPPPRGAAARALPIILRARELRGRPDLDAEANGDVEFRRGPVVIHADRLTYDQAEDLARATGSVVITRDGNVVSGPELQLRVQRFEGFFLSPRYRFARTGAGGQASRIDFIDDQHATATDATYSSCTPDDDASEPAWQLKASRIALDTEENEGVADGAVLRFLGVPILAAPRLSFPLNEQRKSGLLPPNFGLDSRSGFQASIPWYWNIAPNRDATVTGYTSTRRGPALAGEFRYLESGFGGDASLKVMPHDRTYGDSRWQYRLDHAGSVALGVYADVKLRRASDDDYWKDFPSELDTPTPRLLGSDAQLSRAFGDWVTYARVQRWQVLQTADVTTRIVPTPYERLPQVGVRYLSPWRGLDISFEAEANRFVAPGSTYRADRQEGLRLHALGAIARPFERPGWTLTPRLSFNAASYDIDPAVPMADGRTRASRVIPTVSLDSAWTLERDTTFFGRRIVQTLEPRLFYVNTPYRAQENLPDFDAWGKDFNLDTIYTENAFSGVDRVSDAHALTAGVTTRLLDPQTGVEALRLGLAQRYLFRDQRITPDGNPVTRRFSDILLLGSTTVVPNWTFDVQMQYDPDDRRIGRSLFGVRYSPGPFRTVNLNYRLARGLSEQVELGWQWPIWGHPPPVSPGGDDLGAPRRPVIASGGASSGSCRGTLYGVGRINYSTRDRRLTDGIAGLEYDAGCWIGRIIAERTSVGRSEATTRLLLQLELVGLSRIGSNPLKVLKDNIPGYRLLRDERATDTPYAPYD